ncbi:MAG: TrkH family potassium uptake protein [Euryarchaeota archaeon]|jgi:trk system potassium uptake protein TrkH|nr:TrkH family potassium uptake protein [Euryarchaeota archaeon]MBT5843663.1 TrkH family potassium uptake protein [Euryarchaeota archaeon]MBT6641124.1 TrkH family potassium uptake protein [Euryarchaeota archaeon]MBT7063689.1 TrkH family potassium uptake protein [Euryarchaeota archaeon]MBT7263799.1 TrkH family potassium uptake protein [Euryarchaeota archaeon]
MRFDVLNLILGWTLIALTLPLVLCGLITIWLDDLTLALYAFAVPAAISPTIGILMLSFGTRTDTSERLRDREAFAAVALVWPIAVFIGSLPFWLGGVFVGPFTPDASIADIARGAVNAWFESMSGFTTTGATVISHNMSPNCIPGTTIDCINAQPQGLLIWRSLTQWFGGMGIIMLGMMLLSRIIGGGMALARAELTGPSLSRLRPKLKQTALALWGLYLGLTIIECICLKFIGGMTFFDAVNHALTTMPTGGFSTHDASIGYYDSFIVEFIVVVFMFLAGVNFTLLWMIRDGQYKKAFGDEEFRNYTIYILVAFVTIATVLLASGISFGTAFRDSLFQVVSLGTSTGYASADYMPWPVVTHLIIFILMIVGASAGSTGGGLKLLRVTLAFKVAMRELVRIAQPRKVDRIRMNGEVVERQQIGLIVGMLFVWVGLFGISSIILAIFMPGGSFESITTLVASSLGNTGPALGDYGPTNTWSGLNSGSLLITSILMWFGRLELLTAVILIHPRTWRREKRVQSDRAAIALFRRLMDEKQEKKKQG